MRAFTCLGILFGAVVAAAVFALGTDPASDASGVADPGLLVMIHAGAVLAAVFVLLAGRWLGLGALMRPRADRADGRSDPAHSGDACVPGTAARQLRSAA